MANSASVGDFAAYTLQADTSAMKGSSPGDEVYLRTDRALRGLEVIRDRLAGQIKGELESAEFGGRPVPFVGPQTIACQAVIRGAQQLASSTT